MKLMTSTYTAGTGETYCTTPEIVRVRLNNTPINMLSAFKFIAEQCDKLQVEPYFIEFSERKCQQRYGTCYIHDKRIVLYRHCVGTLLHEFAHAIAISKKISKIHDKPFAQILDYLIKEWHNFETKNQ